MKIESSLLKEKKSFKKLFPDANERRAVNLEFANFSDRRDGFADIDALTNWGRMEPKAWWLVHGVNVPLLQKVALEQLAQPCSSSCNERNWSTYSFIHSLNREKQDETTEGGGLFIATFIFFQGIVHSTMKKKLKCGILLEIILGHLTIPEFLKLLIYL